MGDAKYPYYDLGLHELLAHTPTNRKNEKMNRTQTITNNITITAAKNQNVITANDNYSRDGSKSDEITNLTSISKHYAGTPRRGVIRSNNGSFIPPSQMNQYHELLPNGRDQTCWFTDPNEKNNFHFLEKNRSTRNQNEYSSTRDQIIQNGGCSTTEHYNFEDDYYLREGGIEGKNCPISEQRGCHVIEPRVKIANNKINNPERVVSEINDITRNTESHVNRYNNAYRCSDENEISHLDSGSGSTGAVQSGNPRRYRGFIQETMSLLSLSSPAPLLPPMPPPPPATTPLSSTAASVVALQQLLPPPPPLVKTTLPSTSATLPQAAPSVVAPQRRQPPPLISPATAALPKPPATTINTSASSPAAVTPQLRRQPPPPPPPLLFSSPHSPAWKEETNYHIMGGSLQPMKTRKPDKENASNSNMESPSVQSEINSWNARDFTSTSTPRPKDPRFAHQRFFSETPLRPPTKQCHSNEFFINPINDKRCPPCQNRRGYDLYARSNPTSQEGIFKHNTKERNNYDQSSIFNHFSDTEMPLRPVENLCEFNPMNAKQFSTQRASTYVSPLHITGLNQSPFGFDKKYLMPNFSETPLRPIKRLSNNIEAPGSAKSQSYSADNLSLTFGQSCVDFHEQTSMLDHFGEGRTHLRAINDYGDIKNGLTDRRGNLIQNTKTQTECNQTGMDHRRHQQLEYNNLSRTPRKNHLGNSDTNFITKIKNSPAQNAMVHKHPKRTQRTTKQINSQGNNNCLTFTPSNSSDNAGRPMNVRNSASQNTTSDRHLTPKAAIRHGILKRHQYGYPASKDRKCVITKEKLPKSAPENRLRKDVMRHKHSLTPVNLFKQSSTSDSRDAHFERSGTENSKLNDFDCLDIPRNVSHINTESLKQTEVLYDLHGHGPNNTNMNKSEFPHSEPLRIRRMSYPVWSSQTNYKSASCAGNKQSKGRSGHCQVSKNEQGQITEAPEINRDSVGINQVSSSDVASTYCNSPGPNRLSSFGGHGGKRERTCGSTTKELLRENGAADGMLVDTPGDVRGYRLSNVRPTLLHLEHVRNNRQLSCISPSQNQKPSIPNVFNTFSGDKSDSHSLLIAHKMKENEMLANIDVNISSELRIPRVKEYERSQDSSEINDDSNSRIPNKRELRTPHRSERQYPSLMYGHISKNISNTGHTSTSNNIFQSKDEYATNNYTSDRSDMTDGHGHKGNAHNNIPKIPNNDPVARRMALGTSYFGGGNGREYYNQSKPMQRSGDSHPEENRALNTRRATLGPIYFDKHCHRPNSAPPRSPHKHHLLSSKTDESQNVGSESINARLNAPTFQKTCETEGQQLQRNIHNSNPDILNASNIRRISLGMFHRETENATRKLPLVFENDAFKQRQKIPKMSSPDCVLSSSNIRRVSFGMFGGSGQRQNKNYQSSRSIDEWGPSIFGEPFPSRQENGGDKCEAWNSNPFEKLESQWNEASIDTKGAPIPTMNLPGKDHPSNQKAGIHSDKVKSRGDEGEDDENSDHGFIPAEIFIRNLEKEIDLKESKLPTLLHEDCSATHPKNFRCDTREDVENATIPKMRRISHPGWFYCEKTEQHGGNTNGRLDQIQERRLTQEMIRERLKYRRESLGFKPKQGHHPDVRAWRLSRNSLGHKARCGNVGENIKGTTNLRSIRESNERSGGGTRQAENSENVVSASGLINTDIGLLGKSLINTRDSSGTNDGKNISRHQEKKQELYIATKYEQSSPLYPLVSPSSSTCGQRETAVKMSRLGSNETISSGYLSLDRNNQKQENRYTFNKIRDMEIVLSPRSCRNIQTDIEQTRIQSTFEPMSKNGTTAPLKLDKETNGDVARLFTHSTSMPTERRGSGEIHDAHPSRISHQTKTPPKSDHQTTPLKDNDVIPSSVEELSIDRDGISDSPGIVISSTYCNRDAYSTDQRERVKDKETEGGDKDGGGGKGMLSASPIVGVKQKEEGHRVQGFLYPPPIEADTTMYSSDQVRAATKPVANVAVSPHNQQLQQHHHPYHDQQQQQIQLDGSIKTYDNDNFFQELEKDFGQLPQFPSSLGQSDVDAKSGKNDRNNDRGRAPYTSTLEHKHRHTGLSSYNHNNAAASNSTTSHPSKSYDPDFSSSPDHHYLQPQHQHHQQQPPHLNHPQNHQQRHQQQPSSSKNALNENSSRRQPQNSCRTSFSSHSNCSSLRSDSHYSSSYNNNRHSPASRQNSFNNSKPQPQVSSSSSSNNNSNGNHHHHQFMSSPSSSSSHHRREDHNPIAKEDVLLNPQTLLNQFKHKGSGSTTTSHLNFTPVYNVNNSNNNNNPSLSSPAINRQENADNIHPSSSLSSSSKHRQNMNDKFTSNNFASPELPVFTGSSHEKPKHNKLQNSQMAISGSGGEGDAKLSRNRQNSDGFIPTTSSSSSTIHNHYHHDHDFENNTIESASHHHHHNHHDHLISSNSDSEQERTLRRKDSKNWAQKLDKNNDSERIGGDDGIGGNYHHSQNHWPETNYSYSDNEKQLLEEMRRMKKEHQNVLRTYEGRVNKLMAKMHELRNIAEMLENNSTKTSPFGVLPGKLALLNILAENTDDDSKKGAKGEMGGGSGGGSHLPPPLPPRPLRGSRVYPNKPIVHPNVVMRNLPWERIILDGGAVPSDVLWKDMVEADTDKEELERLFSGTDEVNSSMNLYEDICQRRGSVQMQPVRFYESEHSQRIHSELCNLKCNLQDISKAFVTLNPGDLHIDSFAELLELLTSHREIDKIIHHGKRKGSSQLDVPEYLVFELSKIDHFKERLEFLRFKNKLQINLFEIDQQLKELHIACDEISSNLPLKHVLETVLAVGNYMNGGTDKGQADGYRIEILTSLKYLQDKNKRGNLLELIMKIYCLKHEWDQDFGCPTHFRLPEPSNMRHAAQVSFEDIQRALKELKDELTFVMNKLESLSKRQTTIMMSLRVTTENFFTSAVEVLAEEQKLLEDTKVHFIKTTAFFSHNQHPTSPKEFFQLWASFLHDCKYYWKLAHRNLARAKFTEDLAMKNQMSSSSLPGFNNLKTVMMKHVVSFQKQEEEIDESKAQQLQHISSWIESIGRYAMEMQPEGDGGNGGFPNLQPEDINANSDYSSLNHQQESHQQQQQQLQNHYSRRNPDQNNYNRPHSPPYVNSAMYQTERPNPRNQPDVVPPSDHHHNNHNNHQHHHSPSSPKPLSAIPPNVHKPQPISHTSPTISSPSSSSPNLHTPAPNLPSAFQGREFNNNNNKDESDDNFGFSSPPPPIVRPPIPSQLNLRQDLTPEMLIPDKSLEIQSPTSPTGTSSHSKKNQNFFKAFLKKDQKKSSPSTSATPHSNSNQENAAGAVGSQNASSSSSSKAVITPFNKLKNTFVQKLSGSGSKKTTDGKLENSSDNAISSAQNFSPVEEDTMIRQQQQESLNSFPQQEYEAPQFQSHSMIKSEMNKLKKERSSGGGPDYQNCQAHGLVENGNDHELMHSDGANANDNHGCLDANHSKGNDMNTISRYQDQVSSMYGFRQLDTNNDLHKSTDQLNEMPGVAHGNSKNYHSNSNNNKPKSEVSPTTSSKSGSARLRAPIALGSNISISDVFGNSGTDSREQENFQAAPSEKPVDSQFQQHRQSSPHIAQIRIPKVAAVPTISDPKLVRAEAVPVYKAKLIPNYENQTKLDPRVDFGAIRGQAEPVLVPPMGSSSSSSRKPNKELYKMELQKQSERYVSAGSHSTTSGSFTQGRHHEKSGNGGSSAGVVNPRVDGGVPLGAPTTYTVMPPKSNHHFSMSPFQVSPPMKQQQEQQQEHSMIPPSHSSPHLFQHQNQYHPHHQQQHQPDSDSNRDLNYNIENKENSGTSSLKHQSNKHKSNYNNNNKGYDDYENSPAEPLSKSAADSTRTPGRRSTSAHNLLSGNLKEQDYYQSDQANKGHVSRRDANDVKVTPTTRRAISQGRLKPSSETVTSLIDRFEKKQPTSELGNLLDVSEKPPSMTSTPVTRRKNAGGSGNVSASNSDAESQRSRSRSNQPELKNNAGQINDDGNDNNDDRNLNDYFSSFGTPSQVVLPFNSQHTNGESNEESNLPAFQDNTRNIYPTHQPEFETVISGSAQMMQQLPQSSSSSSSRPKASSSSLDRGRQAKPISSTPQNFHHNRNSPMSRRDNIPGPQQSLSPATTFNSQARTPSDLTRSDQGGRSSSSQRSIHSSAESPHKNHHHRHSASSHNQQNNPAPSAHFQSPYLPKPEPQYPTASATAAAAAAAPPPLPPPLSSSPSSANNHHHSHHSTPNQRLIQPHVSTSQQNLSANVNSNQPPKKAPRNLIHSSKSQHHHHSHHQNQHQQHHHPSPQQQNAQQDPVPIGYNSWPSPSSSSHSQQQQQQQQPHHRSRRDLDTLQQPQQQSTSDVGNLNYSQQLRKAYQSNTLSSAFERPLRPTHNQMSSGSNHNDNNGGGGGSSSGAAGGGSSSSGQRGNTAIVKPTVMHL